MEIIKNINYKKAFTLVELIVVITILAILGTIAFISFAGYSKNSRDSVRIADINNIQKNLGIFVVEKGYYPNPDNGIGIAYKGSITWTQGTVGDTLIRNLVNLNKKPSDPLTETEYTYSITNNKFEYQIGSITETSLGTSYNKIPLLTEQTYAADKNALAKIKGTYNEKILKVSAGGIEYILAIPTIITANLQNTDLETIINNKELVYNNFSNLPDAYKNLGFTMTGGFDYITTNIIVYTGSEITLKEDSDKLLFLNNLKNSYSGTIIQDEEAYKDILNSNINTNEKGAIILVNNYIQNNIGGIEGKLSIVTNNNGTQANCSATGSYIYNGHYYSISNLNHSETVSGIISTNVNENNGVFKYTLTNIECNDGKLVNENESAKILVSCNTNYAWDGNNCVGIVNGVCGTSNGQNLTEEPTTGLCSSGNASSISGSWPWNWTCNGIGGTNQNCSAGKEKINLVNYRSSMIVTGFGSDLTNLYDGDVNSSIIRSVPYIAQTKPGCGYLFPTVSAAQAAVGQIVIDMGAGYESKTGNFIISGILTESNGSSTRYNIDHEPGVYCTETPVSPVVASYGYFRVYDSVNNISWTKKAETSVSSNTVTNKQKIFTLSGSITGRYIKIDVIRGKNNNSIRIPQIDIELKDLQIYYEKF